MQCVHIILPNQRARKLANISMKDSSILNIASAVVSVGMILLEVLSRLTDHELV
jgi:hypothetical protein